MTAAVTSRWVVAGLIATSGVVGSCRSSRTAAVPPPAASPGAVRLREIDGVALRQLLAGARGHDLVVQVWASWCQPCLNGLAGLADLAHAQTGRLEVLAISVDAPALAESAVASALAGRSPGFAVLIKTRGEEAEFRRLLDPGWDGTIPTTFIFDRNGTRKATLTGPRNRGEIEKALASPPG